MLLNVLDYPATPDPVQSALDDAKDGDRIYIPGQLGPVAGGVWQAPAGGWKIRRAVEIFGDGPGLPEITSSGTTLAPSGAGNDVLVIQPTTAIESLFIHDLRIRPLLNAPDGQCGISCDFSSGAGVGSLRCERIVVVYMASDAFRLGSDGAASIDTLVMVSCYATASGGSGFRLKRVRQARIVRCTGGQNTAGSVYCTGGAVGLYVVGAERDTDTSVGEHVSCRMVDCDIALLEWLRVEDFYLGGGPVPPNPPPVRVGLEFSGCVGAAGVCASAFVQPDNPVPHYSHGIKIKPGSGGVNGPVSVLSCLFTRVDPDLVNVDATMLSCCILPQTNDVGGGSAGGMVLPTLNGGLVAMPYIWRLNDTSGEQIAGLVLPAFDTDPPDLYCADGMLCYRTTTAGGGGPGVRVRLNGSWYWAAVS